MDRNINKLTIAEQSTLPTVAIVGRPNVGKSALFNAIIGKRISIVHSESGITRDNVIYPIKWEKNYFQLIDTGGLASGTIEPRKNSSFFESQIGLQVETAVKSADLLLFVVDITTGVTHLDEQVAATLRRSGKHIILVINKADNDKMEEQASEFSKLGFEEAIFVSCLHRRGIEALIISFTKYLWTSTEEPQQEARTSIAIVGRPNCGKSSIINKLIGTDKLIVSNIPGTTRDAIETPFDIKTNNDTLPITLIDTAGLRKKGRANTAVEIFSIMRTEEAIKKAEIVLFVIEAGEFGATAQDAHIGQLIEKHGKACIIVANKWDIYQNAIKQTNAIDEIRKTLPFLNYAPIVFTCAISGYNLKNLLEEIYLVFQQYKIKIPTSTINQVLTDAITKNSPPCIKSKFFKIFYATMVSNKPPLFLIFVNDPKLCTSNYLMYLKNYLRKSFNLHGLPIHIKLKPRTQKGNIDSKPQAKNKKRK